MLIHSIVIDSKTERGDVLARISRALELVNESLALRFEHDGAETVHDVVYTVWTDDVDGNTETSWLRLTDDGHADARYLDIHATTHQQLDSLVQALDTALAGITLPEIGAPHA